MTSRNVKEALSHFAKLNFPPDILEFWDHLDNFRDDWDTRLIFADRLEELGEIVLAEGQRWQVEYRRHPGSSAAGVSAEGSENYLTNWFHGIWDCDLYDGSTILPHGLPHETYMNIFFPDGYGVYRQWIKTLMEGEIKLAEGLGRLKSC